jgi:hypothetical protein
LINFTENQNQIRERIKRNIEQEISMCDDHADLLLLATILYDSAKNIFTCYAKDLGEEALEKAYSHTKKATEE